MKDPWKTLGVPKGADAAALKKAKRQKQRALHPDRAGGDGKAMAEVNQAYDILSDPERLARFQREGRDQPMPPDPERLAAQRVMAIAAVFLANESSHGGLLAFVRRQLNDELVRVKQAASMIARHQGSVTRARKRLSLKGEGNDFLDGLFEQRLAELAGMERQRKADEDQIELALELTTRYEEKGVPEEGPRMTLNPAFFQIPGAFR